MSLPHCCEEFNHFMDNLQKTLPLTTGCGELESSIRLEIIDNLSVLSIGDGFGTIPNLEFYYCPFCASKQ